MSDICVDPFRNKATTFPRCRKRCKVVTQVHYAEEDDNKADKTKKQCQVFDKIVRLEIDQTKIYDKHCE